MPSTWCVLGDRVRGEPARRRCGRRPRSPRCRARAPARARTAPSPSRRHAARISDASADDALALAVVAHAGRLDDRRVADRRVGVGGRRPRRTAPTGRPASTRNAFSRDAVLGDRDRRRPTGATTRAAGEAARSAAAGGFSNSVVTTAHRSPSSVERGRVVVRRRRGARSAIAAGRRSRVGVEHDRAVAHRAGRHQRVAAELAAAEHADRRRRLDHRVPSCRWQHRGRRLGAALVAVGAERGRRARVVARPASPRRTARRWWRPPRRSRTSRWGCRRASARSTAASPGPDRWREATGTPSTGTIVLADSMPGRCAAPPAPAMIARSPRADAASA